MHELFILLISIPIKKSLIYSVIEWIKKGIIKVKFTQKCWLWSWLFESTWIILNKLEYVIGFKKNISTKPSRIEYDIYYCYHGE